MFATPRPKKSPLPPPRKKRKTTPAIEEISFDNEARLDYLTGFHKRKLQRIKNAQEIALKKARQERLEFRKKLRDERRQRIEEHVQNVTKALRGAEAAGQEDAVEEDFEAWAGLEEDLPGDHITSEEVEYIDEDKYTTVVVESVTVDRDGLHKPASMEEEEEEEERAKDEEEKKKQSGDQTRSQDSKHAKRKKAFRYESKAERLQTQQKLRAKKRSRIK